MSTDAALRAGDMPVRAPRRAELVFYGICRSIAVGLSRLVFPGPVIGADRLPKSGPYVVAPLHRSYVDWLLVARITRRRLRYVVKGEVWSSRFFGRLLEALGAFPVQRGAADREALHRALEVLMAGEPLVVFPEGTRGEGFSVSEVKDGAAYLALRAGVPIVPVGIAGAERAMPRGARFPRPARVLLLVGEPITPSAIESASGRIGRSVTKALSEELRRCLERLSHDAAELESRRHEISHHLPEQSPRSSVEQREEKKE